MATTLRWNDYSLSEEQQDVAQMLRDLFSNESPAEVVRAAEPLGFAQELWATLVGTGVLTMSLPERWGGDGAGLLELALAAEEIGHTLAPVPLIDHVVAARLAAAALEGQVSPDAEGPLTEVLRAAVSGEEILSLAPLSARRSGAQLVPSGAVARGVLALVGDDLVLLRRPSSPPQAANEAASPLAWWDPADAEVTTTVVASGETAAALWRHARDEWQVATAAALVGLADGASAKARQYSLERKAFGSLIATFQAISHTLVNLHIAAQTARNLVRKAAWFVEFEPGTRPELAAMALAHAARVATDNTAKAVHVHGGLGITLEADVSLFHRRAAAWGQVGGGSRLLLETISSAVDQLVDDGTSTGADGVVSPSASPSATGDLISSGATR